MYKASLEHRIVCGAARLAGLPVRLVQSQAGMEADILGIFKINARMQALAREHGVEFAELSPNVLDTHERCVWCKAWICAALEPVSEVEGSTCLRCCMKLIQSELKQASEAELAEIAAEQAGHVSQHHAA